MLENLHVKNFALIEETEVDFGDGLNILTGETGAGKSILIDAVSAALGGRVRGNMIRQGCDSAYVELTFSVDEPEKIDALRAMDVQMEYDCVTVSRRILPKRSIHKVNGETVTSAKLRQITALLLDIHGQHEHQSLLNVQKHMDILDQYGGKELEQQRKLTGKAWNDYLAAVKTLEGFSMDPETRLRRMDFLQFEIDEIEAAELREGESEELEQSYRKMQNSQRIAGDLTGIMRCMESESPREQGISDRISEAGRHMAQAIRLDPELEYLQDELAEIEDLVSGFLRDLESYQENMMFDPEECRRCEERLDLIHRMESKYGSSVQQIMESLAKKQEELGSLDTYERNQAAAQQNVQRTYALYEKAAGELSELRRKAAPGLQQRLEEGIRELNFNYVSFRICVDSAEQPGRLGRDKVEFRISLNQGQEVCPLGSVASGGELSRIMLAIKTVLADKDEIPTLIFDEIDTGISGRTAQKVSEKLHVIGQHRQVICITHLPQIASMADHHFEIRKSVEENHTVTRIRLLKEEESVEELARLLGGVELTETVRENAREMKRLASGRKRNGRDAA